MEILRVEGEPCHVKAEYTPRQNDGLDLYESIAVVTGGNRRSVVAICDVIEADRRMTFGFDPALNTLCTIDYAGLHDDKMHKLYEDICAGDAAKTCACIRAYQVGFILREQLLQAVNMYGAGLDLNAALHAVQSRFQDIAISDDELNMRYNPIRPNYAPVYRKT